MSKGKGLPRYQYEPHKPERTKLPPYGTAPDERRRYREAVRAQKARERTT